MVTFLVGHRKQKIQSLALLNKMTQRFVQDIKQYAEENDIYIVHFKHGQRKDDIANQMRRKYPKPLRKALDRVDREIDNLIEEALYLKDAA